ncbi:MAG: peptidylprolyl isomerase [Bacteroidota bacterium]|nr:peptidylprolyl isomerase [Bacteroidota bacterium]
MKATKFVLLVMFVFTVVACSSIKNKAMREEIERQQQIKESLEIVNIKTEFGDILIWLYDQTPKHKTNFLNLTQKGFYTGTTFHRIIDNFMIQGGDPLTKDSDPENDGNGGPGYTIPAEFVKGVFHDYATIGAAREGDVINPQKRSSGSQFYIVENSNGAHHLDGNYTVFGKVISGMKVVETIAEQKKDHGDKPIKNITMQEVKIIKTTEKELKEKYNFFIPEF